ncbi:MAG: hypothetical protein IT542_08970 [Rubellimicrobium sp.]|nr:hypothetical protein [Rubellimicrobium sp.]
MTGMTGSLVAARTDGFGVRLLSLLNAMALSDITGLPFRFHWEDNKSANPHHSVEAAEICFDAGFLDAHVLSDAELQALNEVTPAALLGGEGKDHTSYCKVPQSAGAGLDRANPFRADLAGHDFRKTFLRIGFSPKNARAIDRALHGPLPEGLTAIHLRAGDVVYGEFRLNGYWVNKVIPYQLAIRLITGIGPQRCLLFCQDGRLGQYLGQRFPGIRNSQDMMPPDMDSAQQALFDMVLMSRCTRIIAGRSGFSMVAARLAAVRLEDYTTLFSPAEIARLLSGVVEEPDGAPDGQRAFSALALLENAPPDMPVAHRIRVADFGLRMDPGNAFFAYRKILCLLEGDSALADAFFSSLTREEKDRLLQVVKRCHGRPKLADYCARNGFEATLLANPSQVSCVLLAAIGRARGDLEAAREWSHRAETWQSRPPTSR